MKAYKDLEKLKIKDYYTGKIIVGCEFKCFLPEYNIPIEILGYGINPHKIENYFNINSMMKIQERYLKHLKNIGKEIGLIFDEKLELNENQVYAAAVFEEELLKYPENKNIMDKNNISLCPNFYRAEQCNKNSKFYIDEVKDYINLKEIIEKIHNVGGLAFLAHPYQYPICNVEKLVEDIAKNYEIDGVECYYPTSSKEDTKKMLNICEKYKLYISGGSDFHGAHKPGIKLGEGMGNLKVEKIVIEPWLSKVLK